MTAERTSERPQHEVPYLHVRAPKRVVGVGGEGDPLAKITANRAGLLRLREQVAAALEAAETVEEAPAAPRPGAAGPQTATPPPPGGGLRGLRRRLLGW